MLKRSISLALVLTGLWISSCSKVDPNSQIDEGTISDTRYTSAEIGWTIHIPEGWKLLTRKQVDAYEKKGSEAISSAVGKELDLGGLKNLLNFQKNPFNIFQSTSQPFAPESDGDWRENNKSLKAILLTTFQSKSIGCEVSETSLETIDGIEFEKFEFAIFAPDGNVILRQILYGRLINGYDFGVNISYNDEQLRDEMLAAWRASKFEKQEEQPTKR